MGAALQTGSERSDANFACLRVCLSVCLMTCQGYLARPRELLAVVRNGFHIYRCELIRGEPVKGHDHEISWVGWMDAGEIGNRSFLGGSWGYKSVNLFDPRRSCGLRGVSVGFLGAALVQGLGGCNCVGGPEDWRIRVDCK